MDGTRMGSRSSTRHGPAAVFSGPVRRWKKAWAPVSSNSSSSNAAAASSSSSRILLYKWVPLTPGAKEDGSEEPIPQGVRYMPVSIVLAQKKEASKKAVEEAEAATEQNVEVANGELIAQADALDHPMANAEIQGDDGTVTMEEKSPLEEGKDEAGLEEKPSQSDSPSTGVDVAMADEQDQSQDAKLSQGPLGPSGVDLEDVRVPSDSSAASEAEG